MSLSDYALTTLTALKAELGITGSTEDSKLERIVESVSRSISSKCNRLFHYGEDIAESVAGYGSHKLLVSRVPILSIDSISIDGSEMSSSSYEIGNALVGEIYNQAPWANTARELFGTIGQEPSYNSNELAFDVVYTGGYVTPKQVEDDVTLTRTLPYDLEQACLEWCVSKYRGFGSDPNISGEKLLSYSVSYGKQPGSMPEYVSSVLDSYTFIPMG